MKFSDIVIALVVITFFPFNEGMIAKSPLWKKLNNSIELTLISFVSWRANANVTNELEILTRYFRRATFITFVVLTISLFLLKSQMLFLWASSFFGFFAFAWFSFDWTFKHREAIQPFLPMVGYSLVGPWAMLLLDQMSPQVGLANKIAESLTFLPQPLLPTTSFEVAFILFVFFLAFFSFYYLFFWVLLSPFAYGILLGLKVSQAASAFLVRRFNRNLLADISIAVQIFAVVYFYIQSR